MSDDIEWIVRGDSTVSETTLGKARGGEFWAAIAEKSFTTTVRFLSDDDIVVVLTQISANYESAEQADVLSCIWASKGW